MILACMVMARKCYTEKMSKDEREQFEALHPDELAAACLGELHPMAAEGIRLFDQKDYWHAHEALEEAWLEEPGPVRQLYKGILQAGVAYLQVQRGNFIGAMKMHRRSQVWLTPWPEHCRTVDVAKLKADLEVVIQTARRLGPERLDEFELNLLKPIRRVAANHDG